MGVQVKCSRVGVSYWYLGNHDRPMGPLILSTWCPGLVLYIITTSNMLSKKYHTVAKFEEKLVKRWSNDAISYIRFHNMFLLRKHPFHHQNGKNHVANSEEMKLGKIYTEVPQRSLKLGPTHPLSKSLF